MPSYKYKNSSNSSVITTKLNQVLPYIEGVYVYNPYYKQFDKLKNKKYYDNKKNYKFNYNLNDYEPMIMNLFILKSLLIY